MLGVRIPPGLPESRLVRSILETTLGVEKSNPLKNGLQFVHESRNELRKVTWPARKEAISITVVVIIAVFVSGFYLAVIDWGLSESIKFFIR